MKDLWLVYRCRQGDPEAFSALYQRYYRTVYRTALGLVRERALAEDITQEAFVTAFQQIARLRTPAAFRTWLYRLVVSRTTRELRAHGGTKRPLSLDLLLDPAFPKAPDPAESRAEQEEQVALRAAIAALDEDLRLTVLLHYFSDLPTNEVAAVLSIPAGTVKSRLHTARRRLAIALAGDSAAGSRSSEAKELSI